MIVKRKLEKTDVEFMIALDMARIAMQSIDLTDETEAWNMFYVVFITLLFWFEPFMAGRKEVVKQVFYSPKASARLNQNYREGLRRYRATKAQVTEQAKEL